MATLRDVANRAGVTVTTVSRMLNGRVRVSSETLPMMIRQAIMMVTEAKDINPCVEMLRKPSRIK